MLDTEESGLWTMTTDMGEELRSGMMAQSIKDSGKTTRQMEKDDSFMLMETCMRETGSTIRLTVKESIPILMELNTLETGKKINRMVMVLRLGQMVQSTQALMSTERNTERESSCGLMDLDMRESSTTTTFME